MWFGCLYDCGVDFQLIVVSDCREDLLAVLFAERVENSFFLKDLAAQDCMVDAHVV